MCILFFQQVRRAYLKETKRKPKNPTNKRETFNLKNILMQKWSVIQNQPPLKTTFTKPPIISYERGKSLKDILVRAKL